MARVPAQTPDPLHPGAGQLRPELCIMQATREPMLRWLAACLNSNKERDKLQPDIAVAAPHGFSLNVLAVLLHASQPFLQDHSIAWGKLDPRCDPFLWDSWGFLDV